MGVPERKLFLLRFPLTMPKYRPHFCMFVQDCQERQYQLRTPLCCLPAQATAIHVSSLLSSPFWPMFPVPIFPQCRFDLCQTELGSLFIVVKPCCLVKVACFLASCANWMYSTCNKFSKKSAGKDTQL